MAIQNIGRWRVGEVEIFSIPEVIALNDIGVTPDNVDTVLCTHLHFDHVGWNAQKVNNRWVPTFPNARYLFGRIEYEHWMMLYRTKGYHHLQHVEECIMPIIEAGLVDLIEMEHRINQEVWLEPTPGHTPVSYTHLRAHETGRN